MKNKKKILKFLLLFLIIAVPLWVNAEYKIEVSLPGGPAASEPVGLAEYVDYLYKTLLAMVGLAAVGALVFGGFQYMLSDSVTSKDEAKKWIWGAIGGLLLGFSAYLILHTINPDFTEITPPQLEEINAPTGNGEEPECTPENCPESCKPEEGCSASYTWNQQECKCSTVTQ